MKSQKCNSDGTIIGNKPIPVILFLMFNIYIGHHQMAFKMKQLFDYKAKNI